MNARITHSHANKMEVIDSMAELLLYPGKDYHRQVQQVREDLFEECPDAAVRLNEFLSSIGSLSAEELEESYLNAFELNPSGVAYTGIHLFGEESFKRGAFMAELNARYQKVGLHPRNELTDHIAVVLKFYARISEEDQMELAQFVLLGTLKKMSESSVFYTPLFDAVLLVVQRNHPRMEAEPFPISMTPVSCDSELSNSGCGSGCGMKGAGMGDRDFLTSEDES